MQKLRTKSSKLTSKAMQKLLNPFKTICHTITQDNGKEFACHEEVSRALNTEVYFAHPYSAWERGLNEQVNGLIRQYLPKRTDFSKVSNYEITQIMNKINNRPRKLLGYKTPFEVLASQVKVNLGNVALVS